MLIQNANIPVKRATELLEVSKSGYYKWRRFNNNNEDGMKLRNFIQNIAIEFPSYGYRRVTAVLRNHGHIVNHKKVLRLMGGQSAVHKEDVQTCYHRSKS